MSTLNTARSHSVVRAGSSNVEKAAPGITLGLARILALLVTLPLYLPVMEEYYNVLEAPYEELIWLEGGDGLGGDNLGQFVDVMVNKVLAETYPADD